MFVGSAWHTEPTAFTSILGSGVLLSRVVQGFTLLDNG